MGIFTAISEAVARMLKNESYISPLKKVEIVNFIENNLLALKLVNEIFTDNADILRYVKKSMLSGVYRNTPIADIYNRYLSGLSQYSKKYESDEFLGAIHATVVRLIADHELLIKNMSSIFGDGTSASEVSLKQMRVTHAAILGYLQRVHTLTDWVQFAYTMIDVGNSTGVRIPGYRQNFLVDNFSDVAKFVDIILNRRNSENIITEIQAVSHSGENVLISSGSNVALEDYADASTYAPSIGNFVNGWNPIMWIVKLGDHIMHINRWRYECMKAKREWMVTKTTMIRLQMEGLDPDSAEYQRLVEILSKYSDIIAMYDKKIAEYEQS